jgi:hypothetical protein
MSFYDYLAYSTALRNDEQTRSLVISYQARLRDVNRPKAWFLATTELAAALI